MFTLSDIFLGDYPIVEYFGASPAIYSARYGLQGYPGIRIKCPSLTPILATADGFVLETGFEEAGKGNFITLVHEGFLSTYGHLNDIVVRKDEKVIAGQLIAHSNQSGLTEIPCLYFGIAPSDAAGTKLLNNGFGGYIDPLGDQTKWEIQNRKEPASKANTLDKMTLSATEYSILNAQATNFKVILSFLKQQTTFDEYLKDIGHAPVNLDTTPDDSAVGEAVNSYLNALSDEFEHIVKLLPAAESEPEVVANMAPPAKKNSLRDRLKNSAFIRFIFVVK